jgi:hypothetical protein
MQISWDIKRRRKRTSDKYNMRVKDIKEKDDKKVRTAFGRGLGKGFQATQKGGILAPDALEKGIKNFFTDPGAEPDKPDTSKSQKGGKGTDDAMNTAKADAEKVKGDAKGALAIMAAKRKYSKELKGYDNKKADIEPATDARLVGNDGNLYHWDGKQWLMKNDTSGRYEKASDQSAVKANWIDAAKKGKTTFIKKESKEENMSKAIKEGLADLAGRAEADHEVQMARADLYKIAKYAIKLHDMLKGVSEETGLEGWQQAKITKAADYMGSVYHNLDYDMKFGEGMNEARDTHCSDKCCGSDVKREDCTCPPDCKHCNCNATNVDEGKYKNDAQRKAVHASKAKKDKYKESIAKKLEQKLTGK